MNSKIGQDLYAQHKFIDLELVLKFRPIKIIYQARAI